MKVAAFDFELPPELVAQHPAVPRDAARLLEVGTRLQDRRLIDLPQRLKAGDLLVYNDTRVIKARLYGKRGAAAVEVTLHKQVMPAESGTSTWRAFARPAKKLKPGDAVEFGSGFAAMVVEKGDNGEVTLQFPLTKGDLFVALERHGHTPLPPYIRHGRDEARDESD